MLPKRRKLLISKKLTQIHDSIATLIWGLATKQISFCPCRSVITRVKSSVLLKSLIKQMVSPVGKRSFPPSLSKTNNNSRLCRVLGQEEFTERDVEVFRRYLTFCGIGETFVHLMTFFINFNCDSTGIQNAQLFENSVLEYKRNQILLNLARSIFEEQNNLECLVTKIMKEAKDLLKCERCAVFLVDLECCEAVITERVSHSLSSFNLFFPFILPSFSAESFGENG